jgi:hypothetical protein
MNLLKVFVLTFIILSFCKHNLVAQDSGISNESYTVWKQNGVGVMYGGSSVWINYKRYFTKFALEANVGYLAGGDLGFIPRFQVNFLKPYNVPFLENLQWYWGIGAHYQAARVPYFQAGGNLLLGLEYNILEWSSSIFFDAGVQPSYRGKNQKGMLIEYPARIGFRYRF